MFRFQKLGPKFEKIEYKRLVFEILTSASVIRMSGLVRYFTSFSPVASPSILSLPPRPPRPL